MNHVSIGVKIDSNGIENGVKIYPDGVTLFNSFLGVKIDSIGLKCNSKEFRVNFFRHLGEMLLQVG